MPNKSPVVGVPRPTMRPDHVQGFVAESTAHVDRHFYVLEKNGMAEDRVWEFDGYKAGDNWCVHIVCPICGQNLKLDSTKKKFQVTPEGIETGEPIKCSWPGTFGQIECKWAVEFVPPRRDDRVVTLKGGDKIQIDAVARRI